MLAQPIKEQKRKIKLSELSDLLKVKKSTIKQWEKDFNLQVKGSLYCEQEIYLFKKIKQLLHQKRTSLENAKKELEKFFAATEAAFFQLTESDSDTSISSKEELKIEKKAEEALIFEEKQNFDLATITKALQAEKEGAFNTTTKILSEKSITTEKQHFLSENSPNTAYIATEAQLNQSFKEKLQKIKVIALIIHEKLQK